MAAVIGTGIMGAAMARNLVAARIPTTVWDRSPAALETLVGDFAPEFPLQWALKDVDLALGGAGGDSLPLLAALSRQWHAAVAAGHGREDVAAARLALGA